MFAKISHGMLQLSLDGDAVLDQCDIAGLGQISCIYHLPGSKRFVVTATERSGQVASVKRNQFGDFRAFEVIDGVGRKNFQARLR